MLTDKHKHVMSTVTSQNIFRWSIY